MIGSAFLWPGRLHDRPHISTRQDARLLKEWGSSIRLVPSAYGTPSMRRPKVAQIYKKTGNLRAMQLRLGTHDNGQHRALSRDRAGRRDGDLGAH